MNMYYVWLGFEAVSWIIVIGLSSYLFKDDKKKNKDTQTGGMNHE